MSSPNIAVDLWTIDATRWTIVAYVIVMIMLWIWGIFLINKDIIPSVLQQAATDLEIRTDFTPYQNQSASNLSNTQKARGMVGVSVGGSFHADQRVQTERHYQFPRARNSLV